MISLKTLGRMLTKGVFALSMLSSTALARDLGTPAVWQPNVINGPLHDSAPAFSPDGNTVYFGRSVGAGLPPPAIFVSCRVHGKWSMPTIAPFSCRYGDMEPAMSPDGRFMIFVSNRPDTPNGALLDGFFNGVVRPGAGGNLWRVDKTPAGWSVPHRLPNTINDGSSIYAPAITRDGSVYFMRPHEVTKRFQLFRSTFARGQYTSPHALAFSDGKQTDVDPAVAPDESFMIFGSGGVRLATARGMDLFIVFKSARHGWGRPVHLGPVVNAAGSDAEARLSPDLRTLYFSSERVATQPSPAAWNNGKYNIWTVPLEPTAMAMLRRQSLLAVPADTMIGSSNPRPDGLSLTSWGRVEATPLSQIFIAPRQADGCDGKAS